VEPAFAIGRWLFADAVKLAAVADNALLGIPACRLGAGLHHLARRNRAVVGARCLCLQNCANIASPFGPNRRDFTAKFPARSLCGSCGVKRCAPTDRPARPRDHRPDPRPDSGRYEQWRPFRRLGDAPFITVILQLRAGGFLGQLELAS
jgi:hypothetical protein